MQQKILPILSRRIPAAVAAALILVLLSVSPALAHTRVESGPYVFIIGWEKEPVIVGERNALLIEITDHDAPVPGAEGSLAVTVFYGGRSFIGQLAPASEPGTYRAEIVPTVRGQYELQVSGEIDGNPVEFLVEPEEVLPADVLQFPEPQPDPGSLQAEVTALEDALGLARGLAVAGVIMGTAGLLVAIFAIRLAIRTNKGAINNEEAK